MTDAAPVNEPSRNPDDFENTVLGEDLDAALSQERDPNAAPEGGAGTLRWKDAGSFARRFDAAAGDQLLASALAVLGTAATLAGWTALGLVLTVLAVAGPVALRYRQLLAANRSIRPTGTFLIPRVLLVVVLATLYPDDRADEWLVWLGASGVAILTAAETSAAAIARGAIPYAMHLPGVEVRNRRLLSAGWVFVANVTAVAVFGILCWSAAPGGLALVPAMLAAAVTMVVLVDGTLRIRARRIAERTLNKRLAEYGATFLIHWDAPRGALYQLAMWVPYLEQLGERFLIVVRHPANFNGAAELTTAPVLLRRALEDMDALITPSLKTAFYVNTAAKNLHFLRYSHLNHIQLNHGDSDKGPSYSRVFRIFDKNFVAGQAAIDRFEAHGITVPREMFAIVGRPQVQAVQVRAGSTPATGSTVLYAPTWSGFHADANYSSLPIGASIVTALLRRGCRVVFRPHPYTYRNAALAAAAKTIEQLLESDTRNGGPAHLWGDAARVTRTVFDCFNESDAMITDVSSVAADYLYSEKPFAITAMTAPAADLMRDFPLARAAYILDPKARTLDPLLDELLIRDPLEDRRHQLKVYYLGDFPPETYADAFLTEARKYV
jgi:CDP-Glycerol:Poly(glycerophosphate) glycerophosphotransferase